MLGECRLNYLLPLQPFVAADTAGLANCDLGAANCGLGHLTGFAFQLALLFNRPRFHVLSGQTKIRVVCHGCFRHLDE